MQQHHAQRWLSELRFTPYLDAQDGDHERAVALYNWNAEISSAFFEIVHHVEVLLRNAIDVQFPASDPAKAVSICESVVWMTDSSILFDESRERVNEAIARVMANSDKRPTRARLVAALSFGFWRSLFIGRYEELWRSHLRGAFPHGRGKRREVAELLTPMLLFRNRIAHHEAIFDLNLEKQHRRFVAIAALIDPEAGDYIGELSRVPELLEAKP